MDPARWRRAREIFHGAVELPTREQFDFLDRSCAGDEEIRQLLDKLIAIDRAGPDWLADGESAATEINDPDSFVGRILGRYKITDLVGEGGMAVVYGAQQIEPFVRRVAVKIIRRGMSDRALIARFEAERQALAIMEHPNIAKILDAGSTDGGRPYFVMEYVEGSPITHYCAENGLNLRERLQLFAVVCQAVRHAHGRGVIHRDIKPSNILVRTTDGVAEPIVIDFGIAKSIEQITQAPFTTELGSSVGTPGYMSPEQYVTGDTTPDARSDVYSLGVVLFELLTGTLPYDSDAAGAETAPPAPSARIARDDQRAWPVRASEIGHSLNRIVVRAIQRERDERYPTVNALTIDLRHYLDAEALQVARAGPSTGGRLTKRPVVAFLLGIVVLALGMLVGARGRRGDGAIESAIQAAATPSIAVLALVPLNEGERRDPLAIAIATDLITRLSKLRDIRVVDTNPAMLVESSELDPSDVGRRLGVRYILRGTLQRSGDRLRVSTRLLDAESREQLWAEDFDSSLTDIFQVQDVITSAIAAELNVRLIEGDQARIWRASTSSIAAYEIYSQALELTYRMSRDSNFHAARLYEAAIELDPMFAQAYAMLGITLMLDYRYGWSSSPETTFERALWCADQALRLDPALADGFTLQANVYLARGDVDRAVASAERAVEASPGGSQGRAALASSQVYAGKPELALAEIQRAIRLSPYPPTWYLATLGNAYHLLGEYENATDAYRRVLAEKPDLLTAHIRLVSSQVAAGRWSEARESARQLLRLHPDFEVQSVTGAWGQRALPYKDAGERERLVTALRSVGIGVGVE